MRGGLTGLPVAHPIGERLPAVYAEDDFAQRMTSALDDVLSPVFATLDCLPDYFDPILAPSDFVEWLSGWVAFAMDEGWTLAQRRALVANAVELHRWRGTTRGLASHVRLLTGGDVEIVDSGACTWSERPGTPAPKPTPARVEVRVKVPDPRAIDQPRLLSAIVEAVPAHVQVVLEVSVGAPQRGSGRAAAGSAKVSRSASVPPAAGSAAVPPGAGYAPVQPGAVPVQPPIGSAAVPPPAGTAAVPPPAGSAAVPPAAGSAAVPPAAGSAAIPQQPGPVPGAAPVQPPAAGSAQVPPPATGRASGSARVRPPSADNDEGRGASAPDKPGSAG
jgi:phage tail-like protein